MTRHVTRGHVPLGLAAAAVAVAADQASKWWVTDRLGLRQFDPSVPVLTLPSGPAEHPDGLFLTMVHNSGITFGLLHGVGVASQVVLVVIAAAVVAGLFVWLRRADSRLVALAVGAIAGGALGNVIDRLRLGHVTDFVDARLFGFGWYVFNVADALIVCGVAVLVLDGLRGRQPDPATIGARHLRRARVDANDRVR